MTELTTRFVADTYNIRGSSGIGDANIGAVVSMCFNSLKATSACGVQVNLSDFFINAYRGSAFSPSRLTKRLSEARQPVNFCTSTSFLGRAILSMADILAGFASIPRRETRKPSSFPAGTPKVHFSGFNFSRYLRRLSNVCRRSWIKVSAFLVFMTTSSTYTSGKLHQHFLGRMA